MNNVEKSVLVSNLRTVQTMGFFEEIRDGILLGQGTASTKGPLSIIPGWWPPAEHHHHLQKDHVNLVKSQL